MTVPSRLQVSSLPGLYAEEAAPTTSPARGAEMRDFLQARLQKNRAPPLVHSWDFYHDRQDRANTNTQSDATNNSYATRLEHLATINDVRHFCTVFNNFPLASLALRDTIHLFHHGTQPLWEHPRNQHGGAWTFRVPKPHAAAFWQEVCLMAIGEQLQAAVEQPGKRNFRDDICGVSLSVRFNSCLVQVWNRDAGHTEGVEAVLKCVLEGLSEGLRLREGQWYYKAHAEHAAFQRADERVAGAVEAAARENHE